jgi:hypothetical protein
MRLSTLSCGLLACIVPLVSATALTYKLSAHEKACFYTLAEQKGVKVAFYFAVRPPSPRGASPVELSLLARARDLMLTDPSCV